MVVMCAEQCFTPGSLTEAGTGTHWDPDEVQQAVAQRVARFRLHGVGRGDRVFLLFGNSNAFFAELLALWRVGACAVPIDARLSVFELGNLATAAQPRLVVVDHQTDPASVQALQSLGLAVVNTALDEGATADTATDECAVDDDALILFTSGSTGQPKGVVHTHHTLQARWKGLREHLGMEPFARTLCLLPTHFGHGLICNSLFPWLSGCDLVIAPPFQPAMLMRLGQTIDEHRISFLSSVPAMWKMALKLARSPQGGTLRRVHVGSAPLSAVMWEEVRRWAGTRAVCNAYGITETGSWLAGLSHAEAVAAEDGLIGTAWGGEIKILPQGDTQTPLDFSRSCAPGETGFVWIKTDAVMKGYFQRDDLTAQAMREGWFLTGDLGYLDAQGRLVLRGRERDEINKGGMKIYPADIDTVVEQFPGVKDVCTFAQEDEMYGQSVAMAVVLESLDPAGIRTLHVWMKERLAEHKLPTRWWVVENIPRTSRGKLNREAVKATCQAQPALDLSKILQGDTQ
jgi:oxalate---CoA ligase